MTKLEGSNPRDQTLNYEDMYTYIVCEQPVGGWRLHNQQLSESLQINSSQTDFDENSSLQVSDNNSSLENFKSRGSIWRIKQNPSRSI